MPSANRCYLFLTLLFINPCNLVLSGYSNYCPEYCKCDISENFNRADCSSQNLISPSVYIPKLVEILDLHRNEITTLENSCFEGMYELINLTISDNAIHTIYLDAFTPLTNVNYIDLSNNRLEYFDDRIFENNRKLKILNLSGNKFMSLANKPILRSTSIEHLSLRNAQINHIYQWFFKEMPSLVKLDLADNLMITLSVAPFMKLKKFKHINLNGNRWICDGGLESAVQHFLKLGADVQLTRCKFEQKKPAGPKMFERMVMAEAPAIPTTTTAGTKINIDMVWKKRLVECNRTDPERMCQMYSICMANMKILLTDKTSNEHEATKLYSANDLSFIFFIGIMVGVIVILSLITCIMCLKRTCTPNRTKRPARESILNYSRTDASRPYNNLARSIIPRQPFTLAPPIAPRHRRQQTSRNRAISPLSPPPLVPTLNRSFSSPTNRPHSPDQADFASFISRLFERPARARHQYYRTINQNTANMIRRLSRSNLLNNRLSQHFLENRINNTEGDRHDRQQLIEPIAPAGTLQRNLTENAEGWQNALNLDTERRTELELGVTSQLEEPPRPETPPPSYREVVGIF